jgi:hypothetical protein
MTALTRRLIFALPLLTLPAFAAESSYRGWRMDDGKLKNGIEEATLTSLKAQIDLVESLKIRPEIKAYFRDQVLTLDPALEQPGRAGPRGLFLSPKPQSPENPVLLHELLHVYHASQLPDGQRNTDLLGFYAAAKTGKLYPEGAYVLSNVGEFFAMNASVVLWGKAARPPYTRANVQARQPDLYDWIVREFGLKL